MEADEKPNLTLGIITVSDRSSVGERPDASGPVLRDRILRQGWVVASQAIIPDEPDQIADMLRSWADTGEMDVILTTGGTGLSPRDVTPEATAVVVDRLIPGIGTSLGSGTRRLPRRV